MATKVLLEVSVDVDVPEAALAHWVFSQLNMPGVADRRTGGDDVQEADLDAIDAFEGDVEVVRFEPMRSELCSTEGVS